MSSDRLFTELSFYTNSDSHNVEDLVKMNSSHQRNELEKHPTTPLKTKSDPLHHGSWTHYKLELSATQLYKLGFRKKYPVCISTRPCLYTLMEEKKEEEDTA